MIVVVLVSLLLTLNLFHTFSYCFYCWAVKFYRIIQSPITCSKLMASFWRLYCYFRTCFTPCSSVFIVNFKHVVPWSFRKGPISEMQLPRNIWNYSPCAKRYLPKNSRNLANFSLQSDWSFCKINLGGLINRAKGFSTFCISVETQDYIKYFQVIFSIF